MLSATLSDAKKTKKAWRTELLTARRTLSAAEVLQKSAQIRQNLQAHFPLFATQKLAFYWAIHNEANLLPLVQIWQQQNAAFRALLPQVIAKNAPLMFREFNAQCAMQTDRFGIQTPINSAILRPEVLLIPLVGFDKQGFRLGYGGGFYDRTISALAKTGQKPLCVGIAYDLSLVDSITPEAHDQKMDFIVTESGVFSPLNQATK